MSRQPMKRAIVIGLVATVLVVAGCGDEPRASITPSASHQLVAVVAQVRTAATSGDVAAATARLTDIRRRVISLRRQGELSEDAATRILLAAGAVEADLRLAPTTTTRSAGARGMAAMAAMATDGDRLWLVWLDFFAGTSIAAAKMEGGHTVPVDVAIVGLVGGFGRACQGTGVARNS